MDCWLGNLNLEKTKIVWSEEKKENRKMMTNKAVDPTTRSYYY